VPCSSVFKSPTTVKWRRAIREFHAGIAPAIEQVFAFQSLSNPALTSVEANCHILDIIIHPLNHAIFMIAWVRVSNGGAFWQDNGILLKGRETHVGRPSTIMRQLQGLRL